MLYSRYEIMEEIAEENNMRTSVDEDADWDIWFIDGPIIPSLLIKIKNYQRTNHFPGMYVLARKNLLAKSLLSMREWYP
jgi:tubulin polyglutamylase TTLL6/13